MPLSINGLSSIITWRYAADSRRDLRLDLLRGYCVAIMTIDHVDLFPAWTLALTGGVRLWVTAVEGFVLIAGIVFGTIFSRYSLEHGWSATLARVGRRALRLYALGVIGHWLINTLDFGLRLTRGLDTTVPANYFDLMQAAVFQTQRAPVNFDLMPLYALLVLWGLVALYALRHAGWPWVVAGSAALWYAARLNPRAFTMFAMYFNFAIWQWLFVIGLLIGHYRQRIADWWTRLPLPRLRATGLILSALAVLIISYQINVNGAWPESAWLRDSALFNRPLLAPGRIIITLWVCAGLYQLLTVAWRPLNRLLGWLLLPLGQHALTAFVLQALLTYAILRLPGWPFPDHDPILMGWLHIGAVLLVWVGTRASVVVQQRARQRWVARTKRSVQLDTQPPHRNLID